MLKIYMFHIYLTLWSSILFCVLLDLHFPQSKPFLTLPSLSHPFTASSCSKIVTPASRCESHTVFSNKHLFRGLQIEIHMYFVRQILCFRKYPPIYITSRYFYLYLFNSTYFSYPSVCSESSRT